MSLLTKFGGVHRYETLARYLLAADRAAEATASRLRHMQWVTWLTSSKSSTGTTSGFPFPAPASGCRPSVCPGSALASCSCSSTGADKPAWSCLSCWARRAFSLRTCRSSSSFTIKSAFSPVTCCARVLQRRQGRSVQTVITAFSTLKCGACALHHITPPSAAVLPGILAGCTHATRHEGCLQATLLRPISAVALEALIRPSTAQATLSKPRPA